MLKYYSYRYQSALMFIIFEHYLNVKVHLVIFLLKKELKVLQIYIKFLNLQTEILKSQDKEIS